MKLLSIFIALFIAGNVMAGTNCGFNVSSTVTAPKCANGSDGSISLAVSGGNVAQTSTKGLLISEFLADPAGTDSPFEYVELLATKTINFAVTPYTVIFNNNGVAQAGGWVQGAQLTYAFSITTGTVAAGDVIYVGGSSMAPTTNQFRTINTSTTNGDGGIGTSSSSGVLGNGGNNADGIAVFDVAVASITSSTVPIDAIFFGTAIGQAFVTTTTGYQLPVNDHYSGGKLQSNSFLINNPLSGQTHRATGVYDVVSNTFTTPRTWVNNATLTEGTSTVSLAQLYSFAWSNGETTQNVNSLATSTYSVTITDATSCEQIEIYNVIEPDPIAVNLNFLDASCFGASDGGATTLLFGGTPNFSFEWSNGATTQDLSGVIAGNYDLTVTDANNCTADATAFISEPDPIDISLTFIDASCFGATDGGATTLIFNGVPSFDFEWSNGATTQDLSGVIAGNYDLTVTDDDGCTATATAFIAEPDPIEFDLLVNDVSCFGANDGDASVQNISGGSGTLVIDYGEVTGTIGITDGTGNAAEITPGEYTVAVYEFSNPSCGVQETFFITEPNELVVNANVTPITCNDDNNAVIGIVVAGGSAPFSYEWADDAFISDAERIDLEAGTYEVTVSDDNSCSATATFVIANPSVLSLTFDVTDATGATNADGEVDLTVNGGVASYTYEWSNVATTQNLNNLLPAEYCVTVTDANGCAVSECVEVDFVVGLNELQNGIAANAAIVNNSLLANISYTEAANLSVEVYSINGTLMLTEATSNTKELNVQHNTSNWSKGIYMVRFNANNKTTLKKLLLQ